MRDLQELGADDPVAESTQQLDAVEPQRAVPVELDSGDVAVPLAKRRCDSLTTRESRASPKNRG